ncbi:MAG: sigma-54-dependent Fis family transcriptional regulator [Gammaproteobacteria bacterium]|nr:sigma-54-dependent Fis family transcriptional regulator [Gammaproteobacteria bacterium]MCP5136244.1 sigma-54-dependent Fis family transcriptional regulator [Gammaproteobacteria bacterium]
MSAARILVVDDEPDIRSLVQEILADEGFLVSAAENGASARAALSEQRPDLILLDIWMPDIDGISLLKEWSEGDAGLPCPVVMMSGHGTVETAVEATRLGAYDFLEKPLSLAKLLLTVERALEAARLVHENVGLRKLASQYVEPIGRSAVMNGLRDEAKRIAQHDAWVLITGEAGAGKQTFARYIHESSPRRKGPFIAVAVGSIARENSAVELFGSEEDDDIHHGRLEQANGGTLFLDQVEDMDGETQGRLLSALQDRRFLRVGGNTPVDIDVRVIAANGRNLEEAVNDGRFRQELFYRLNVVPLHIPPLREHPEDVPEMLNLYIAQAADRDHLPFKRINTGAVNRLRQYPWAGNVLELRNLVQRLLIHTKGDEIGLADVEAALGQRTTESGGDNQPDVVTNLFDLPLKNAREQFERIYLEHHLRQNSGSVAKIAGPVGMDRTNLYRKLRSLELDPKQFGDDE